MKAALLTVGVILVLLGIGIFAYPTINYDTRDKIAEVGSVQLTAETEKTFSFPPYAGGISIAAGIILVLVGSRGRFNKK